ncbi:MAG: hypothetical protein M3P33_04070 [bacterium]|nr:hypothetical protein [bacterium]
MIGSVLLNPVLGKYAVVAVLVALGEAVDADNVVGNGVDDGCFCDCGLFDDVFSRFMVGAGEGEFDTDIEGIGELSTTSVGCGLEDDFVVLFEKTPVIGRVIFFGKKVNNKIIIMINTIAAIIILI